MNQKRTALSNAKKASRGYFVGRKDCVVWKIIDQKGILLNLANGSYFEAGPVALTIWKKCDGRTSLSEMTGFISKKFHVKQTTAQKDILKFISELKRQKLVKISTSPVSLTDRIS